jgi:hypothetical protein
LDPRLIPYFYPHLTAIPFTGVDDVTDLSLKASFNAEKTPSTSESRIEGVESQGSES